MSTFNGKIEEIPEISVDRFNGENVNSTIYFLSHCHTDHMIGLDDWSFHKSLIHRPDVFLYASSISIRILKGMYPMIEPKLKELPIESSTLVKLPYTQNKYISVTPLPAGHCPGSVMFLFETEKTVLYTGDYRVGVSDLKKYKAFYSLDKLKKFDKIYLDTTFFKTSYLRLPVRQESLESICKIIRDWINLSEKHIVRIALSARYGSEYLFLELAKAFGMPIHVSSETYRTYKYIPEMDKAITLKRTDTQIHAGCGRNLKSICIQEDNLTRVVIPSVLWWENEDFTRGVAVETEKGQFRVCYSCHASFEEIRDFLLFLKPIAIEPCVVPDNNREKRDMLNLLDDIVKAYKDDLKEDNEIKLFDTTNAVTTPAEISEVAEDISDLDDILASPNKGFKKRRL